MKKKIKDPFKDLVLTPYEQEIEDAIAVNDPVSGKNVEKNQEEWAKLAGEYLAKKKSKRINIRIDNMDLVKVKSRAERSKVPYQTLLSALIHQYAEGKIKLSV